jgi:hypothetical protein
MTPKYEVDMEQGADWNATINWYGDGTFRAPIEEIDPGYPTVIRVTAHGLPASSDTPMIISGVKGAEILNSEDTAIELVAKVDADTFSIGVSTVACDWVIGTGEVTYHKPTVLSTGYTAVCQLKKDWYSSVVIADLTTENGGIILAGDDGSIQLTCTAAQTAAYNFTKAYGEVKIIHTASNVVTRIAKVVVTFHREHAE